MDYNIKVTNSEAEQIKNIIKADYIKKQDESTFEENYKTFLQIPEFPAMGSIYDEEGKLKKEYKGFNKWVHLIMRLVAQYHINQAMKALKFDTVNDVNLATDGDSNIGTPGRIAKVWWGDKLDNSVFSEYGDGRFVPTPRLAIFPVDSIIITGKAKKAWELETFITKDGNEYIVTTEVKWITPVFKFIESDTGRIYFTDKQDITGDKVTLELFPDQEIVVKSITQPGLASTCSHHFLPFFINGKGSGIIIAYKPYKYLLGISKLTRIVEFCLNRPSLQEESTNLIFKEISKAAGTQDVFVGMMKIIHTCEFTRGASKETTTTTEKAGGCFKNEILRKNIIDSL